MDVYSINIFDTIFYEPLTFVTDLLLTGFGFYFFYVLQKNNPRKVESSWSLFFLYISLSTLVGGIGHVLGNEYFLKIRFLSWILSGVAIYFIEMAVCYEKETKQFKPIFLTQLFLFLISIFYFKHFLVVSANSLIGIGLVALVYYARMYIKTRDISPGFISLGILVAFTPVFLNAFKIKILTWFNYNDLSHLIMILCLYFMFYGVNINKLKTSQG